jgi:hypothetical protein
MKFKLYYNLSSELMYKVLSRRLRTKEICKSIHSAWVIIEFELKFKCRFELWIDLNSNQNLKVWFESKVTTTIRIQMKSLNFGDVTVNSLLKVALQFCTMGSTLSNTHLFFLIHILQHINIIISMANGTRSFHLIYLIALSGFNRVGTEMPICSKHCFAKDHL